MYFNHQLARLILVLNRRERMLTVRQRSSYVEELLDSLINRLRVPGICKLKWETYYLQFALFRHVGCHQIILQTTFSIHRIHKRISDEASVRIASLIGFGRNV